MCPPLCFTLTKRVLSDQDDVRLYYPSDLRILSPRFQVPEGFSDPMVKREVGKVYTKSDAAPATVYK